MRAATASVETMANPTEIATTRSGEDIEGNLLVPPQRRPPLSRNGMLRPADWLTFSRFALSIALWPAALIGQAQILGFGLILAAVPAARGGRGAGLGGEVSARGARLDAAADMLLMLSAAAWLEMLHPEIAKSVGPFLAAVAALYAVALAASMAVFRR